jgi:WD40 repeat protein
MLTLHGHAGAVPALAFAPDGSTLASGGRDRTVRLWRAGQPGQALLGHAEPVLSLAFSPDGTTLASGGHDRQVCFWPVAPSGAGGFADHKEDAAVTGLAFAPDERVLWVGTGVRLRPEVSGRLVRIDLTGERPRQPINDRKGVWSLALAADGKTVAWSSGNKQVFVWKLVSADGPRSFAPLKRGSRALAIAPDASRLAAADDWDVKLYDLDAHREFATLKGHKGLVVALAFSPDGRTLASGGWDGTVRFWDAATGRERAVFPWPIGKVGAVAFSPDGLRAAASGEEGTVLVWDLDEG